MEDALLAKGDKYCKTLTSTIVDQMLHGPMRTPSFVKYDHVAKEAILHFSEGRYTDTVNNNVIDIKECSHPATNDKLKAKMAELARQDSVAAVRTAKNGTGIYFRVKLSDNPLQPGWTGELIRLKVQLKRKLLAPISPTQKRLTFKGKGKTDRETGHTISNEFDA